LTVRGQLRKFLMKIGSLVKKWSLRSNLHPYNNRVGIAHLTSVDTNFQ
jgi:hypothetical protein